MPAPAPDSAGVDLVDDGISTPVLGCLSMVVQLCSAFWRSPVLHQPLPRAIHDVLAEAAGCRCAVAPVAHAPVLSAPTAVPICGAQISRCTTVISTTASQPSGPRRRALGETTFAHPRILLTVAVRYVGRYSLVGNPRRAEPGSPAINQRPHG